MTNNVLGILSQMFASLLGLFNEVFTKLDAWGIVLGAFFVFTIYRLLLVPVLGGVVRAGQSDIVRRIHANERGKRNVQVVSGLEGK